MWGTDYCGAPLIDQQGHALGSLCVVDFEPRELSEAKQSSLRTLSRQVVTQLEMRRLIEAARAAQTELTAQKKVVDRLLLNVLPSSVALELKALAEAQVAPAALLPLRYDSVRRYQELYEPD